MRSIKNITENKVCLHPYLFYTPPSCYLTFTVIVNSVYEYITIDFLKNVIALVSASFFLLLMEPTTATPATTHVSNAINFTLTSVSCIHGM